MTVHVHYVTATGEIVGHENTVNPVGLAGCKILLVETSPDHKTQKVDLLTLMVVDKTLDEQALANIPSVNDITFARWRDMAAFDWIDTAPHLDAATRSKWQTYRQSLRDITKYGDAIAMVNAWPLRPDGTDAIAHLRTRIPIEGK